MTKLGVIHIARAPYTGVWALIRQLARWQLLRGYRVALGLLVPQSWPSIYWEQLAEIARDGCHCFTSGSPDIFGTGAYAFHQVHNPISKWTRSFGAGFDGPLVIHFHNAWLSGAYLPVYAPMSGCVATYHGIQGERALRQQPVRRMIHRYWAQRLVRNHVSLVSVDPKAPASAEALFGVPASLFHVVRNGVASPPKSLSGSPRLRNNALDFTVGHVGVIDEGKGWQVTGQAIDLLHERGSKIKFLIAGDGSQAAQAAAWCASRSGWANYLGPVRDPTRQVFPDLDLLALPSFSEGLPMAVIEAFSAGIPVLATPVGGLPDAIAHGKNGFLISRDPEAIARRIEEIAKNPALHTLLSDGARTAHRERFSADVMGRAYETVYSSLPRLAGKRQHEALSPGVA